MTNRTLLILILIFSSHFATISCFRGKMFIQKSQDKEIRTNSSIEKGLVVFENDVAIIHFDKEDVLSILENEIKNKEISFCDKNRLSRYISIIKDIKSETRIFQLLENNDHNTDYFEINFLRDLIDKLILNSDFAIFDKSKNQFVDKIIYRKKQTVDSCCMTDILLLSGEKILDTNLFTDNILVEECD